MTVLKKLKDYLEQNHVSYELGYHVRAYTAQEIAAAQHVPGKEMAKVVMGKEEEFQELFPDCEIGAMPPFGDLYNLEVWIDQVLTENEFIVFQAGSHVETLRIKYTDYARLVNPKLGDFSAHL